jgi:hypothetical protein
MKRINYIFLSFLLISTACMKGVLDKQPLDSITDAAVWNDQVLIDAYLTQAYLQMYVLCNETPNTSWEASDDWNGPFIVNELSDECTRNWIVGQAQAKTNGITITGGVLDWWENSYNAIRTLNEFIKRVPTAPVEENFRKARTAEARFLRAYNYFAMVKRYGGVPLITEPQDINASHEELYRKRNKEKEIYDFVLSEMDAIVADLPERAATGYGRPSKYTALALKSRAALYAGSIAKYGTVELEGVTGINAPEADYFQQAYDAAKLIMASHQYELYNVDNNKVTNFKNVFIKKNNTEVIWAIRHDYMQRNTGGNGWVWDFFQAPKPHGWNAGNQDAPYLEMAEEFEHIDGTPGTLNRTAIQQGLWTMSNLWANKDPRFAATLYTQQTAWKGATVDFHNGLQLPDGSIQTSGSYQNVAAKGTQAVDNSFGTGFGVMKYLEETKDNMGERATSGTDWQLFRYAEVLLNYAEAALELGKTSDALDAINQVRSRAGIKELTAVTMENVRHERKIELAFEGHRYWDLRRWRTAVDVLSVNRSGLRFILDFATSQYKLQVIDKYDGATANPVFYQRNYYLPITTSRTGNNANLVENPGYN